MKSFCTILMLISLLAAAALAQPSPDTLWTRTYGGSGYDVGRSVQQTSDGGYVIAGCTESFGAGRRDFYLVKTNGQGDTLWTRTYGGSDRDYGTSVQQTADGGYVVAGETYSFGAGGYALYLVKTDSQGDTLWTRTYRGGDHAESIQQTSDGGWIVAGFTYSFGPGNGDFYLVKTNSQGDTIWMRAYGGSNEDCAFSVQQTSDGGYIMAGFTESFGAGGRDFYLVKTNSQGDTLWTRTYGGSEWDEAYSVQQTDDGGYIVAGYTYSFATGEGNDDFYLVKTNSYGDTLWTRTYGGSSTDEARCVQQTADGGYIVAGHTRSFGMGNWDFYLVKTNSSGDTLWTRTCGGSNDDITYSVEQTADGGYIVAGVTYSFGAGGEDFWLVKTGPDVSKAEPARNGIPSQYILYPNFPNPFNPSTQIVYALPKTGKVSLKIFNLLGQEVVMLVDGMQPAGTHTVLFDGSGLPSGIYLYRLQVGDFIQARKMVLLK